MREAARRTPQTNQSGQRSRGARESQQQRQRKRKPQRKRRQQSRSRKRPRTRTGATRTRSRRTKPRTRKPRTRTKQRQSGKPRKKPREHPQRDQGRGQPPPEGAPTGARAQPRTQYNRGARPTQEANALKKLGQTHQKKSRTKGGQRQDREGPAGTEGQRPPQPKGAAPTTNHLRGCRAERRQHSEARQGREARRWGGKGKSYLGGGTNKSTL